MSWYNITERTYFDLVCKQCNFYVGDIESRLDAVNKAQDHIEEWTQDDGYKNGSHVVEIKSKTFIGRL